MENDARTVPEILRDNHAEPVNAVFTKILTHVMLGSPQYFYHGGMLRATVRYFDPDRMRPGPAAARRRGASWTSFGPTAWASSLSTPTATRRSTNEAQFIQSGSFGILSTRSRPLTTRTWEIMTESRPRR